MSNHNSMPWLQATDPQHRVIVWHLTVRIYKFVRIYKVWGGQSFTPRPTTTPATTSLPISRRSVPQKRNSRDETTVWWSDWRPAGKTGFPASGDHNYTVTIDRLKSYASDRPEGRSQIIWKTKKHEGRLIANSLQLVSAQNLKISSTPI